jgi:hypothetical protein
LGAFLKAQECNSLLPVFTNNLKGSLKYCDKIDASYSVEKLLPAVFGLFEDLAPYIVYSSRVTNSPKWTPLLNKKFVH